MKHLLSSVKLSVLTRSADALNPDTRRDNRFGSPRFVSGWVPFAVSPREVAFKYIVPKGEHDLDGEIAGASKRPSIKLVSDEENG